MEQNNVDIKFLGWAIENTETAVKSLKDALEDEKMLLGTLKLRLAQLEHKQAEVRK